ncbi:MAG: hypothetical protein PHU12_01265 [Candidatus Aenigmarchaeota archaeon]|nr:hypothetical protein [Candidatus Aenigmarchaeota archaeon]
MLYIARKYVNKLLDDSNGHGKVLLHCVDEDCLDIGINVPIERLRAISNFPGGVVIPTRIDNTSNTYHVLVF